MWKINVGFLLVLAVLALCGKVSYDSVDDVTDEARAGNRTDAARVAGRAQRIILLAVSLSALVSVLALVLINRDVRGREEAEVRLALAHTNLARVNEELRRLTATAEAANRAKS